MLKQLQDSMIFRQVDCSWESSQFGTYEITLNAEIAAPHYQNDYPRELDFGQWTLRQRKFPQIDKPQTDETAVAEAGGETVGEEVAAPTSAEGEVASASGEAPRADCRVATATQRRLPKPLSTSR